jgi:hypothetical protein
VTDLGFARTHNSYREIQRCERRGDDRDRGSGSSGGSGGAGDYSVCRDRASQCPRVSPFNSRKTDTGLPLLAVSTIDINRSSLLLLAKS